MKLYLIILGKTIRHSHGQFYFTIPLSANGLRKFTPVLSLLRLVNKHIRIIGHLHRGDLTNFLDCSDRNKKLFKKCLNSISDVIVLSDNYIAEIKKMKFCGKSWTLPNTSQIEGSFQHLKDKYENKFICLSNYIPTKGLRELTECFASSELNSSYLTIFGQINDQSFHNTLKNIKTDNVKMMGVLNRNDFPSIFKDYDCLILPSPNEGMPLVVLEAMSIGMPVICTKVGLVEEMLGNDYPFLVIPEDRKSLLDTIIKFIGFNKKNETGKMIQNRYLNKYSNHNHKKTVIEIFNTN